MSQVLHTPGVEHVIREVEGKYHQETNFSGTNCTWILFSETKEWETP